MRVSNDSTAGNPVGQRARGAGSGLYRRLSRLADPQDRERRRRPAPAGLTRRAAIIGGLAAVSVVTDYPDASPHYAQAQQIANTGVPLLSLPVNLINDTARAIPALGSHAYPTVTFVQPGYAVAVQVKFPNAATIPFVSVQMDWIDVTATQTVEDTYFYCVGATSPSFFPTLGRGPAKAGQLAVTVSNLDPAQAATVTLVVTQDSIVRPYDRWHWDNPNAGSLAVPGITPCELSGDGSVLGIFNGQTVNAGTTLSFLAGTAPGQVIQFAGNTSGITPASIFLTVFASPLAAYFNNGILMRQQLGNAAFNFTFVGSQSPLQVNLTNAATSGVLTLSGMLLAQS